MSDIVTFNNNRAKYLGEVEADVRDGDEALNVLIYSNDIYNDMLTFHNNQMSFDRICD